MQITPFIRKLYTEVLLLESDIKFISLQISSLKNLRKILDGLNCELVPAFSSQI